MPALEVKKVNLTAHLPILPEKYLESQKATASDSVMRVLQDTVLDISRRDFMYMYISIDGLLFNGPKLKHSELRY